MPFAYSNNGLSWRAIEDGWPLSAGEVSFDVEATADQLAAAFPGYPQASQQEALAMQALAAMNSGLQLSSVSSPALNGTYACDAISQADIIAIETSLNAGKGFPGGATVFSYPDMGGALHAFNEANFTDFAAAVRDFVYGCRAVIAGSSNRLPPSMATIA